MLPQKKQQSTQLSGEFSGDKFLTAIFGGGISEDYVHKGFWNTGKFGGGWMGHPVYPPLNDARGLTVPAVGLPRTEYEYETKLFSHS